MVKQEDASDIGDGSMLDESSAGQWWSWCIRWFYFIWLIFTRRSNWRFDSLVWSSNAIKRTDFELKQSDQTSYFRLSIEFHQRFSFHFIFSRITIVTFHVTKKMIQIKINKSWKNVFKLKPILFYFMYTLNISIYISTDSLSWVYFHKQWTCLHVFFLRRGAERSAFAWFILLLRSKFHFFAFLILFYFLFFFLLFSTFLFLFLFLNLILISFSIFIF